MMQMVIVVNTETYWLWMMAVNGGQEETRWNTLQAREVASCADLDPPGSRVPSHWGVIADPRFMAGCPTETSSSPAILTVASPRLGFIVRTKAFHLPKCFGSCSLYSWSSCCFGACCICNLRRSRRVLADEVKRIHVGSVGPIWP